MDREVTMRNLDALPLVHRYHDGGLGRTALHTAFVQEARRVVAGFDQPESWRVDRVIILLLVIVLHSLGWWLWKQATIPVTAPRLLNSIEVALVSPQPVARPAPPQPQARPETPPEETPKPKPKTKPKPVVKSEKRAEAKPEESAPALPAAPSAPVLTTTAAPSAPFVEADYRADYLHNPSPKYPEIARQRHWEGMVVLRVRVLTDGSSGEVSIERSSGYEVLDETAAEAAKRWNFVPAKRGEDTVATWVLIPIEFKLKN